MKSIRRTGSLDTILTFKNNELHSEWSVEWSTSHIPGMDTAAGSRRRRATGRRRLRLGSLALASCLVLHCRIGATAVSGGLFFGSILIILVVAMVANPLRHFEVYLGQWSLSGPGRAFRIVPMLDGIGIAICINSIVRAIYCCCIASISALYIYHSISDERLPFTYCRDYNLNSYDPVKKELKQILRSHNFFEQEHKIPLFDINVRFWRDFENGASDNLHNICESCNETFTGYPPIYSSPAYNFFLVEVMQWPKENDDVVQFNIKLLTINMIFWSFIWLIMISEHVLNGKLIWNNLGLIILVIPWIWVGVLIAASSYHLYNGSVSISNILNLGDKDMIHTLADGVIVAIYIHAASTGTEVILGKGLNYAASGHIDPVLNEENVTHSMLLVIMTLVHNAFASICSVLDSNTEEIKLFNHSVLWTIPMYSRCALVGHYSHFTSTLLFIGLTFSYMVCAYAFLKSALHTIFEYRVKLVFVEQVIVATLMITCMMLSLLFVTNHGLPLLENLDAIMSGFSMPFICLLELVSLLYVYRSRDFISDMMISTEENTCSTRIGTQWQTLPVVMILCLLFKIASFEALDYHSNYVFIGVIPLVAIIVAVPIRACHNAYVFLKPNPRRET